MTSRNLPFALSRPKESSAVAVQEAVSGGSFVCISRDAASAAFAAPWDAMAAIYQLAYQQTMAALRPRRSMLEIKPSLN